MHVGYSAMFQNISGEQTDAEVLREGLRLADLAEPLGFDSVWAPEHHFTNYILSPDPTQFLTWVAARTERVQLGAMVNVLPWHDPVRVCEAWSVLDHYSGGRAVLGMGRGLGRVEFEGFRLEMGESRVRFAEYTEAILNALETGYIEYDGAHYKQPRAAIRPFPTRSFKGRAYASAVSPQSFDLMARLGVGIMIIAQKPWKTTKAEIDAYRERYVELNGGEEPPSPIIVLFVAVDESAARAEEMYERYLMRYAVTAIDHYQFDDERIAHVPGYEYYASMAKKIADIGTEKFAEGLAELQVWGTPDDVTDKILEYQNLIGAGGVIGVFNYGGMRLQEAGANLRLFSEKVMPRLSAYPVERGIGTAGPLTDAGRVVSADKVSW